MGAAGTPILTGVAEELCRGSTPLEAALGRCLGAIDVSVGPTASVILRRDQKTGVYKSHTLLEGAVAQWPKASIP